MVKVGLSDIICRLRRLNLGLRDSTKPLLNHFDAGVFILSRNLAIVFFALAVKMVGGTTFKTKVSRRISPDKRMVIKWIRFLFGFIKVLLGSKIYDSKTGMLIGFRVRFLWNKQDLALVRSR